MDEPTRPTQKRPDDIKEVPVALSERRYRSERTNYSARYSTRTVTTQGYTSTETRPPAKVPKAGDSIIFFDLPMPEVEPGEKRRYWQQKIEAVIAHKAGYYLVRTDDENTCWINESFSSYWGEGAWIHLPHSHIIYDSTETLKEGSHTGPPTT